MSPTIDAFLVGALKDWFGLRYRAPARMILALYRKGPLTCHALGSAAEGSHSPSVVQVNIVYVRRALGFDAISFDRDSEMYSLTATGRALFDEAMAGMREALS